MKRPDPLISTVNAERLHYSTGELLGANDFRDEQTYHRRQLARALLHLHGSGTVAGLRVAPRHRPGTAGGADDVELEVRPGLALDHAGRLVEVPRLACIRLRRWYEFIASPERTSAEVDAEDLRAAWRPDATVAVGGVVVADIFLAFHECPRGYTPAFASGPFDALDASQPSRVRDAYELSLILRREDDATLPAASDPWSSVTGASFAARLADAERASLDRWYHVAQPAPENPIGAVDPTAVLLARLRLPATRHVNAASVPTPDWSATTWPNDTDNVNNRVRHVVLPAAAVLRVLAP
jgi:hypothetical protein